MYTGNSKKELIDEQFNVTMNAMGFGR